MTKQVSLDDLIEAISRCESYLQRLPEQLDWSSSEKLKASILELHSVTRQLIKFAHDKGIVNKDWMEATGLYIGDAEPQLTITQDNEPEAYQIFYKTERAFASGGIGMEPRLDLSMEDQNFPVHSIFKNVAEHILRSANLIIAQQQDSNIDVVGHYPAARLGKTLPAWQPAKLAA